MEGLGVFCFGVEGLEFRGLSRVADLCLVVVAFEVSSFEFLLAGTPPRLPEYLSLQPSAFQCILQLGSTPAQPLVSMSSPQGPCTCYL